MISLPHVLFFFAGLIYGGAVAFLGHKIIHGAVMRATPTNDREVRLLQRRITVRWWLRFFIDIAALFVLYKILPMLLGAALGIIIFQNVLIVKYIKKK